MRKFGLIGYPLGHSFSKAFFERKFEKDCIKGVSYQLFPLQHLGDLPGLLGEEQNLKGFNVTIPHKVDVLPFLDVLDPMAAKIGAVNCVSIERLNGQTKLTGYNTDAIGFSRSLVPLLNSNHTDALVLGSGGASKAVVQVLRDLGIAYKIVSRAKGDISYAEVDKKLMAQCKLIINTTPLGMYPHIHDLPPLPWEYLTDSHCVYDLIYNPEETLMLQKARESAATTKNGMEMLILQAEASWEIWNK